MMFSEQPEVVRPKKKRWFTRWWAITGMLVGLLLVLILVGFIILVILVSQEGAIPTLPRSQKVMATDDWDNKILAERAKEITKKLGTDVDIEATVYETAKSKKVIESFFRKELSKDGWKFLGKKKYRDNNISYLDLYFKNYGADREATIVIPLSKGDKSFTVVVYDIY